MINHYRVASSATTLLKESVLGLSDAEVFQIRRHVRDTYGEGGIFTTWVMAAEGDAIHFKKMDREKAMLDGTGDGRVVVRYNSSAIQEIPGLVNGLIVKSDVPLIAESPGGEMGGHRDFSVPDGQKTVIGHLIKSFRTEQEGLTCAAVVAYIRPEYAEYGKSVSYCSPEAEIFSEATGQEIYSEYGKGYFPLYHGQFVGLGGLVVGDSMPGFPAAGKLDQAAANRGGHEPNHKEEKDMNEKEVEDFLRGNIGVGVAIMRRIALDTDLQLRAGQLYGDDGIEQILGDLNLVEENGRYFAEISGADDKISMDKFIRNGIIKRVQPLVDKLNELNTSLVGAVKTRDEYQATNQAYVTENFEAKINAVTAGLKVDQKKEPQLYSLVTRKTEEARINFEELSRRNSDFNSVEFLSGHRKMITGLVTDYRETTPATPPSAIVEPSVPVGEPDPKIEDKNKAIENALTIAGVSF